MTSTPRRRPVFHPLDVIAVDPLTADAVAVTFAVPAQLRETFDFQPGQHVTVRWHGADGEARRSYSLCSTPTELAARGTIRIGVRTIGGGVFSTHAATGLRAGDRLDVLPPIGHFVTVPDPGRTRRYAAVAAGSGITPVLSIIATVLHAEPASRFTLIYGNRATATVMFADELADLKDRYPRRLQIVHVLSREAQLSELLSGRLDPDRLRRILDSDLVNVAGVNEWFLCGPQRLVAGAADVLADRGVPASAVHTELFHVEPVPVAATQPSLATGSAGSGSAGVDSADVMAAPSVAGDGASSDDTCVSMTVRLDGRESTIAMGRGERVLDAALRARAELPYACKSGVCSTCRARVVDGSVTMANNYALEPDELAAGYVLTCQSTPTSDRLTVDYDG